MDAQHGPCCKSELLAGGLIKKANVAARKPLLLKCLAFFSFFFFFNGKQQRDLQANLVEGEVLSGAETTS